MTFGRAICGFWRRNATHAAALLAVALFSLAGVQSVVMQAADGPMSMWPICSVAKSDGGSQQTSTDKAAHAACAFCAAASQAPLTSTPAAVRAPTMVRWTPTAPTPALGPRGPPSFQPRARGPPSIPQTV